MGRGARAALVVAVAAMTAGGCSGRDPVSPTGATTPSRPTSSPATSSVTPPGASQSPTEPPDPTAACAQGIVTRMTREEKIGQLLMVGLAAGAGESGVDSEVLDYRLGGVILLGGWEGASAIRATTRHLESLADELGLFIAADQEGGAVQQLRGAGFSRIPSAREQSRMPASELSRAATGWARELAEVGINVNLAPVADTVPARMGTANQPIGRYGREYGSSPEAVLPGMTAFLDGMHEGGIATTVKHFPGLGRITGNTDVSATGITDDVATVDDPFLSPFRRGITAGADFVMISSARYPKIDPTNQAMFSPSVVSALLRGQLGFHGVVITDDVGAAAAVAEIPVADRATRFLDAGGDIVLTARPSDIPTMAEAISERIGDDDEFAAKADAAVTRIVSLKAERGLTSCS